MNNILEHVLQYKLWMQQIIKYCFQELIKMVTCVYYPLYCYIFISTDLNAS